jgi:hypothetical protein
MAESQIQVTEGVGKKIHTFARTVGANTVEDEVVIVGQPFLATYTAIATIISAATAASHLMQLMAGASLNVYVTRVRLTQVAAATTGAFARAHIIRLSTAGTGGTAATPSPLDSSDAASGATGMTLPTVKGTESSTLYPGSFRAIQTIGASGGGQDAVLLDWDFDRLRQKPIRIPAGAANGICLKQVDAVAAMTVDVMVQFYEASY